MKNLVKKYLKGYRAKTILGPVFKLLEALFELFIPLIVAAIIDNGLPDAESGFAGDTVYILKMSGLMLVLYVAGFVCSCICQYFAAVSAFGFGTNLRRGLFKHINTLPLADIDRLKTSSLITRLNIDVTTTQTAVNRFIRLVTRAPFILTGALIMAVRINAKLSLIFFAATIALALALILISLKSIPHIKRVNTHLDEVALLSGENLSGSRVVRAFNKQDEEEQDFSKESNSLKKASVAASAISVLSGPVTYFIINVAMLLVAYFGGKVVSLGETSQGKIIALINYLLQILNAMTIIAMLFTLFTRAGAAAKRINEVLDTPSESRGGKIEQFDYNKTAIEFSNVSFSYGSNAPAIKDISFTLNKDETLGIIGGTGSGKSTLASLLHGFYNYKGSIKLFGTEVSEYSREFLINSVSLAPQKAVLFTGTLRDNFLMAKPNATDEEMLNALKIAQAEFVSDLNAPVARGGSNFSGGQRQRLALARAAVKQSPIIILDDAASALDYATEANLRKELNRLGGTKIIISQRCASVKNANLILVMDEGKCVELGTHSTLMQNNGLYKQIAQIQEGTL